MVDITKEIRVREAVMAKWRKSLHRNVTHQSYFETHPLEDIKNALKPFGVSLIMEDGNDWCGFLCGSSGSTTFSLGYEGCVVENAVLVYNWYGKEIHGLDKIEINAYIS